MRQTAVSTLITFAFTLIPLCGCARLSYGRQVIAEGVKREHEAEIPLRFWGQLLAENGAPVPGAQLVFEHRPKNWPGFAWGGPISKIETILVESDVSGQFSFARESGGRLVYTEPKLYFWINEYWQVIDAERSELAWDFENWSLDETYPAHLPQPDAPAIIQLRKFTRESTLISLKHVENRLGPLPQHFQLLPRRWPPRVVTDEITPDD